MQPCRAGVLAIRCGSSQIGEVFERSHPAWLRWPTGMLWLCAWLGLIWIVHRPWGGLGGLVSERLRWLEWWVLFSAWIVGATLGEIAREKLACRGERSRGLRLLLYPAWLITPMLMAALRIADRDDPIGVVLVGWVSYTAGALSAYLGVGSYCRGERGEDQRSGAPDRG